MLRAVFGADRADTPAIAGAQAFGAETFTPAPAPNLLNALACTTRSVARGSPVVAELSVQKEHGTAGPGERTAKEVSHSADYRLRSVQFRNMTEQKNLVLSVLVSEAEFIDWNRAAERSGGDLSTWVRALVNARLAAPIQPVERSPAVGRKTPLHWRDERGWPSCEYCGFDLDFRATRRKRFCSDVCRVKAWRFQKRVSEAPQQQS